MLKIINLKKTHNRILNQDGTILHQLNEYKIKFKARKTGKISTFINYCWEEYVLGQFGNRY